MGKVLIFQANTFWAFITSNFYFNSSYNLKKTIWMILLLYLIRLTVSQALECLREHCHPSMLDNPDALVWAKLEFNMANVKKDKYIDSFTKMIPIYNPYERGVADKQILVFCKKPEDIQIAEAAGAKKAGGSDLVQDILKGKADVTDYDHFLATEEMALELKPLLGILRDRDASNKIVVDDFK